MRTLCSALLFLAACGDSGPGTSTPRAARSAGSHPDEIFGELSTAERKDFEPGDIVNGGRAVLPSATDIGTFNPYLSTSAYDYEIHTRLYPFPLRENADFHKGPPTFRPGVVDKWSVDGKRITMHIRDDAVWSDGVPITAEDARFSLQAAKDEDVAWTNTAYVDHITHCEVVDSKTYVLHFALAYPYMLKDAKDWRILPKHIYGKIPFKDWKGYQGWDNAARTVSGPYKLESYRYNEEFVLVPNDRYWDKSLPRLERIHIRVLKDKQTIFESLLTGELDMQDSVDGRNARKVLEHPDFYLYNHSGLIYDYLGWNCDFWLFKDAAVRRALTLAINVKRMIPSLLHGYGKPLNGPFVSTSWAYDPTVPIRPYDPEQAEKILSDLGWAPGDDGVLRKDGKPFQFTITTNSSNERRMQAVQYIQADLKKIGVKVRVQPSDFNTMGENLRKGREDAWVGGWWLSSKVDLKNIFHIDSIGGWNFGRWRHKEASRLIEEARVELDLEKARKMWHRIHRIMHEEQPYTWLYELRAIHAVRKKFNNVEINANQTYYNLSEWFIPKELQGMTR
ncbi:MAG: ABC transporter substrate-binding protein [Planctomycetota bacterium]